MGLSDLLQKKAHTSTRSSSAIVSVPTATSAADGVTDPDSLADQFESVQLDDDRRTLIVLDSSAVALMVESEIELGNAVDSGDHTAKRRRAAIFTFPNLIRFAVRCHGWGKEERVRWVLWLTMLTW